MEIPVIPLEIVIINVSEFLKLSYGIITIPIETAMCFSLHHGVSILSC